MRSIRWFPSLPCGLLVLGCSHEAPQPVTLVAAASPPSADLVAELARDPVRLNEVRRLCRQEREQVSEALCIASAKAARQRFMGEHNVPYTAEPVGLSEATPPSSKQE